MDEFGTCYVVGYWTTDGNNIEGYVHEWNKELSFVKFPDDADIYDSRDEACSKGDELQLTFNDKHFCAIAI